MSVPKEPAKAKLIISFISGDLKLINSSIKRVAEKLSEPDLVSPVMDFSHTHYYEKELGHDLKRRFAAFRELVFRSDLPDLKLFTNSIEDETMENGKRRINIDPGILSAENFILATGKNFSHRVYLRDGIFADLTLIFKKNDWMELDWTYPDYRETYIKDMLKKLRALML